MKSIKLFFAAIIFVSTAFAADVIPANRQPPVGTWAFAGVSGGIPSASWPEIPVVLNAYPALGNAAIINAAITAAAPNRVIKLPIGEFLIDGSALINRSNVVLRGSGNPSFGPVTQSGITLLHFQTGQSRVFLGISSSWGSQKTLSADAPQGQNYIEVPNVTGYTAGKIIRIWQHNDTTIPIVSTSGDDILPAVLAQVQSTDATVTPNRIYLNIPGYPGLPYAFTTALGAEVWSNANRVTNSGVENIYFTGEGKNQSYFVEGRSIDNCWVTNCYGYKTFSYALYIQYGFRNTITHNWLNDAFNHSNNNAGIKIDTCTLNAIYDNIIYKIKPGIQENGFTPTITGSNGGSATNVIAYNFVYNAFSDAGGASLSITSHAPEVSYSLHEGNIAVKEEMDAYYGSADNITIARNWFMSQDIAGGNPNGNIALNMDRMTRRINAVGNLLGVGGTTFTVNATGSFADPATKFIYRFGWPSTDSGGSTGEVTPSAGIWWADWNPNLSPAGQNYGPITVSNPSTGSATIVLSHGRGLGTVSSPVSGGLVWSGGFRTLVNMSTSGSVVTVSGGIGNTLPADGTIVQAWPGATGFQEKDNDVVNTMILKGNYNSQTATVSPFTGIPNGTGGNQGDIDESLNGATIADSYYLSGKPSWFGSLTFPPFDSAHPININSSNIPAAFDAIPAGYRYNHGEDPPVVPSAPTNPAVATVSTSALTVSWTASAGATGYNVQRSLHNAGSWSTVGTPSASPFGDTGLLNETTYDYRISASNAAGSSGYSATASGTTLPGAPSGLAGVATSSSSITLTWTNNSNGSVVFSVEDSLHNSGSWSITGTTGTNAITFPVTGLDASTAYDFRIRAFDGTNYSAYSNTATATTQAAPILPSAGANPSSLGIGPF